MSYISNGCNDCSNVDFASNTMGLMGGSQNFGANGNMFDGNTGNQFVYQQQPQQTQQTQQHQQPPQQIQQMPQIQPTMVPMQQQVQQPVQMQQPLAKIQAQARQVQLPAQQIQVASQQVKGNNNQSLTGIIANYFNDNAFTIMIAFLVASAWHTTIKFYINQSIKFNGGNPTYYIVYAVLATLIAIFLSTIKKHSTWAKGI